MNEDEPNRDELNEEFRNLGKNLIDSLKSIWDSPERIKVQQEVEEGLDTFASTIKQEAEKFRQSPTGQQLELELDDLNQRIKSGEAEQLARQEIINVLRKVNQELDKVIKKWTGEPGQDNNQNNTTSEES